MIELKQVTFQYDKKEILHNLDLKIKEGTEVNETEIDFSEAFDREKIEDVENTTKKIN